MKNGINGLSVKVVAVMLLAGFSLALTTPSSAQSPAWTVSKGVQKVSNKKQFENQELTKSHITAATVDQTWVSSKGVSNIGSETAVAEGNIPSKGTPAWTNGKGVHQIKKSSPVTEDKNMFKSGPEITRKGK
jgi:hypothetical protein